MKCYYHPDKDAVIQCSVCGKGLCKECCQPEENLCRDCVLEREKRLKRRQKQIEQKRKESIKKKIYYILTSFILVGIFIMSIMPINSFDSFLGALVGIIIYGSVPSGWRIMTRITKNKIFPNSVSNRVVVNPGTLFVFWFVKFIIGFFIGIFALIFEIYEIISYFLKNRN